MSDSRLLREFADRAMGLRDHVSPGTAFLVADPISEVDFQKYFIAVCPIVKQKCQE
jgi:hypothetical protein